MGTPRHPFRRRCGRLKTSLTARPGRELSLFQDAPSRLRANPLLPHYHHADERSPSPRAGEGRESRSYRRGVLMNLRALQPKGFDGAQGQVEKDLLAAAVVKAFQGLGYVLSGTVRNRLYRCGKPNCRGVTEGRLHGPYDQWTRKLSGKTVNLNLDPESAKWVKEWIQNNQKLRKLCHQLEKTSLAALRATTNMSKI